MPYAVISYYVKGNRKIFYYEPDYDLVIDVSIMRDKLNSRDREILDLLSSGFTVDQISKQLNCNIRTVFRRLHVIKNNWAKWLGEEV